MTSSPWAPLIARGQQADVAAGHTIVPGVVTERYPITTGRRGIRAVANSYSPTYDVQIGGAGGRQHTLLGLTGSVYCQVGHPVWVALPYGDPHRGACIIGRQYPGFPRQYLISSERITPVLAPTLLPFLGHPQTYWVEARLRIEYRPADDPGRQPAAEVESTALLEVDGTPIDPDPRPWARARVLLEGTATEQEVAAPPGDTSGDTGEGGEPSHSHPVAPSLHDHPDPAEGPIVVHTYAGPYRATVYLSGMVVVRDYDVLDYSVADLQDSIPPDIEHVAVTMDAEAKIGGSEDDVTVAMSDIRWTEVGVYTG